MTRPTSRRQQTSIPQSAFDADFASESGQVAVAELAAEFAAELALIDSRLYASRGKHLSQLQTTLLRAALSEQRQSYSDIAAKSGYAESYLKYDAGPKLWQLLSDLFQERVNKSNCRMVLERHCRAVGLDALKFCEVMPSPAQASPTGFVPVAERPDDFDSPAALTQIGDQQVWIGHRNPLAQLPLVDWGEAPEPVALYGREAALAQLQTWLTRDQSRLVVVGGVGGMGKTALAASLVTQMLDQRRFSDSFQGVIWRSLRSAPPFADLLADLISICNRNCQTAPPQSSALLQLLHFLKQQRWLLVLDQFEALFCPGETGPVAGRYLAGYEGYGELLRLVAETAHSSSLLLTSRELPLPQSTVQLWSLQGLNLADAQALLAMPNHLTGAETDWQELVQRYGGNPTALKAAAPAIHALFEGSIRSFLDQGDLIVSRSLRELFEEQLHRLSGLEAEILDWLAIHGEPVSLADLKTDLLYPPASLLEAIDSLLRRFLIETVSRSSPALSPCFAVNPALAEYVKQRFVDRLEQELLTVNLERFHSHALVKAQAQDYLRELQAASILRPLVERLQRRFPPAALERHLTLILLHLHEQPVCSYAAGNLLNILCYLQIDLTDYDFSGLTIWQADLQAVNLHRVNFAEADLSRSVFTKPMAGALSVTFSPDGSRLATSDINGTLRLWQVSDGKQMLTCEGYGSWVCLIAFSPDGQFLASASEDHQVKLWSASTGQVLLSFAGHQSWVWAIAFSANGQFLASASEDQTIRIWSIKSGRCLKVLTGHNSWVCAVAFSPTGSLLVSAGDDHLLRIWNGRSGLCLRTLWGHSSRIAAVIFSPNGELIASASEDQTIKLWSVKTGDCLRTLKGHRHWVWSIAFSPDSKTLISGSQDQTVKVWDVETGQAIRTLQGHSSWVQSVAFSLDGTTVASGSEDQTVRLWNVHTGQCLNTLRGYASWVQSVAFSPDGTLLASSSEDHRARLWQISTGHCVRTLHGHESAVLAVAFSPDGHYLAGSGFDPTIRLWQVSTGDCVTLFQGHGAWVRALAFSPDGKTLLSGGGDYSLRLWSVQTGECLQTLRGHSNWVWSVAFSPDGRLIASCGDDQTIQLWDALTGKPLKTLRHHGSSVTSVAFSPDGQLVSSSADQTIKLWDLDSGACLQTLMGHTSAVFLVTVSPDGMLLASASADQTIRLWDIKRGTCLQTFYGHTNLVFAVTFSPDGTLLASGSRDETIKLWNLDQGQCWRTLRTERPYEGMNIRGAIGLTDSQKTTLKSLGAVERPPGSPDEPLCPFA
jgi:WD40 repeat protein